jgi:hypothetical protein
VILAVASESVIVEALLRYGPLGLVLIAIGAGWLFTKPHVDDLRESLKECREELKEARAEISELQEIMRTAMVPAITQSTTLIQRVSEELLWRNRQAS